MVGLLAVLMAPTQQLFDNSDVKVMFMYSL